VESRQNRSEDTYVKICILTAFSPFPPSARQISFKSVQS
jgi:hypothetical protein